MQDDYFINGLVNNHQHRARIEKEFYLQYEYFIREGCRKYRITNEDSFSAYSDAVLAAINNIANNRFDSRFSLKTYLFQIFHNKCVDLIRKISNNKHKINNTTLTPDLLSHLPDNVKGVVEKLIDQQEISMVSRHLDSMKDNCKELLLLSVDGYTDKEIAEKLGYNNAAVAKTSRLRCREKLYKLFTTRYE